MYVDFFGLKELPFNNTPDPRFFFSTPDHDEALASLIYAVQGRKGFVLLTGEVGAGKTLMSRLMLRHFGSRIAFANINHAVQDAQDLIESVCTELELRIPENATHAQLVRTLHDALLERFARNQPVVLVLDEAQHLSTTAFEQLRMIGNLEADDAKLLQICIVGQPELQARFAAPELRQLRQRLYRSFHLPALNRESTEGYMRHRLKVSGGAIESIFTADAIDEVFRLSRGLPRLINTICDNAMLSAYAADFKQIDAAFARSVTSQMMLLEGAGGPTPRESVRNDTSHVQDITTPQFDEYRQFEDPSDRVPIRRAIRPAATVDLTVPHSTRSRLNRPPMPRSTGPVRSAARFNRFDATNDALFAVRNELARMRNELAGIRRQTSERSDMPTRVVKRREIALDRSTRSADPVLNPVLIRAAAIVERAERERQGNIARAPVAAPPNDSTRVVTSKSNDIASIIRKLDADAETAGTLLRAWRQRTMKATVQTTVPGRPT